MTYTTGNSAQIVVGAAALFVKKSGALDAGDVPAFVHGESYKETLSTDTDYRNVGYTNNGLELMFEPDFGEVKVDQVLDAAKLFKQGMKVELKTSFAEATLENLLVAVAAKDADLTDWAEGTTTSPVTKYGKALDIKSGNLGEYPLERGIIAVGASLEPGAEGLGADTTLTPTTVLDQTERVYIAYRALSIQNVTVNAKRDAPTEFEVTFRMLPNSSSAYGKIVDRTY
jgi:hypothetical protein